MGDNTITRLREQQQKKITDLFMQKMDQFHQVQSKSKKDKVNRMKRVVKQFVEFGDGGAALTDEEVEQMVMEDRKMEEIISKQFKLTDSQEQTLNVELSLATETNESIKQLYYSMLQLHQLFQDFALLVEQQDELLECIEENVSSANEHVVAGVKLIQDSNKLRQYTSPLGLLKLPMKLL